MKEETHYGPKGVRTLNEQQRELMLDETHWGPGGMPEQTPKRREYYRNLADNPKQP